MELVGNAVCLDFVNTLAEPGGLVEWVAAAGLPPTSIVDSGSAVELREAIHRTFTAIVAGADPATVDIGVILRWYGQAVTNATLRRAGRHCVFEWPSEEVLWVVAASAVRLLMDGPLDRVGECPSCGWLFVDTSRNGRRRWCSMATCGSRSKASRYFASKRNR